MNRHGRQTRLAEVGSAGQARIASARVEVAGDGLDAFVAAHPQVRARLVLGRLATVLAREGLGLLSVTPEALARALPRAVSINTAEARPQVGFVIAFCVENHRERLADAARAWRATL